MGAAIKRLCFGFATTEGVVELIQLKGDAFSNARRQSSGVLLVDG